LRPRKLWLRIRATSRGITTSGGTEKRVNLPVASMLFQNGTLFAELGVKRSA
jgi:hypothetical protein